MATAAPKQKVVAVLLAVFLGFWTWLYTYKKDLVKFWIALGLNIFLWFFFMGWVAWIVFWLWAVIESATRPNSFYEEFEN